MIKTIRAMGLLAALLICSLPAKADTSILMQHLQHMRLASVGVMTDFFMYTGLEGDRKYYRRMSADMESFELALDKAVEHASGTPYAKDILSIRDDWRSFEQSLSVSRNAVKNQGYADSGMLEQLNRTNNQLAEQIGNVYVRVAGNVDTNPLVQKTREMAVLLQEMTTQYAASASADQNEDFLSKYRNDMQALTQDFEFKLSDLKRTAYQRSTFVLMDNINNKWRFLRNSITRQHEMDVPFLVISYNDRIIRHLEELETRISNS